MSDKSIAQNEVESDPSVPAITAGSILRAAREREGLHVAALAVSMKVPVKKLEALEANRLDLLPDAVFVRALASSVCRALKIDKTRVLELLPVTSPPKLNPGGREVNTPFPSLRPVKPSSFLDALRKPTVLIVSIILITAFGVYFFPEMPGEAIVVEQESGTSNFMPSFQEGNEIEARPASSEKDVQANAVPSSSPIADAANRVVTPEHVATFNNPGQAASDVSSAPSTVPVPLVAFKARGPVWIQVTNAQGVQLLSRTLNLGEVVGVSGALPFTVIVGRSDMTSVQVRGADFDLNGVSQNNVARFEVKP